MRQCFSVSQAECAKRSAALPEGKPRRASSVSEFRKLRNRISEPRIPPGPPPKICPPPPPKHFVLTSVSDGILYLPVQAPGPAKCDFYRPLVDPTDAQRSHLEHTLQAKTHFLRNSEQHPQNYFFQFFGIRPPPGSTKGLPNGTPRRHPFHYSGLQWNSKA